MHVAVVRIVTSRHSDHTAALLERVFITVQAPGDWKNPSVVWLKYNFNIIDLLEMNLCFIVESKRLYG